MELDVIIRPGSALVLTLNSMLKQRKSHTSNTLWNNNAIRLAWCNIACDPRGWHRGYTLSVNIKLGIHYTGQCWASVWWDNIFSYCNKTRHTYQTPILYRDLPDTGSKSNWKSLPDFTGPMTVRLIINTLRPRQHGRHFADDTFKRIFLNENVIISTKISLKFVP